jgi:hypothetical protein
VLHKSNGILLHVLALLRRQSDPDPAGHIDPDEVSRHALKMWNDRAGRRTATVSKNIDDFVAINPDGIF